MLCVNLTSACVAVAPANTYPRHGAGSYHLVKAPLVVGRSEDDVLPQTSREHPGLLGYVGDLALH